MTTVLPGINGQWLKIDQIDPKSFPEYSSYERLHSFQENDAQGSGGNFTELVFQGFSSCNGAIYWRPLQREDNRPFELQDAQVSNKKPVLGVAPKYVRKEQRLQELLEYQERCEEAGQYMDWNLENELFELQSSPDIPQSFLSGDQTFFALIACGDPYHPAIIWEHEFPSQTTLRRILQQQTSVGNRYGNTYIAECRILPETKR